MDGSSIITTIMPPFHPVPPGQRQGNSEHADKNPPQAPKDTQSAELAPSELRQLEQLKRRDREVKAHEMAHKATAGQYAKGGASFEYQVGPDGRRYAIGGEVSIDIGKEADPEKTLQKALVIRRAALAPADPSGQDRQIAVQANLMAAEARQEIRQQEQASASAETDSSAREDELSDTQEDKGPTPSQRRAIASFHNVANLNQTAPQHPIDQFI